MKFTIGGSAFDAARVIYRDQGYGTEPGVSLSEYTLNLTDEELLGAVDKAFEEFAAMCKKDDSTTDESDVPELKSLNYPSLHQMLAAHRADLAGLLKDYLYFQLLDGLLGRNKRSDWRFAINDITEISDERDGYSLRGGGYFI